MMAKNIILSTGRTKEKWRDVSVVRLVGFYAIREDARKVEELWLIDALANPRPKLKTYKAELAGDKNVIQYELIIGDLDTKEVRKIDISRWKDQYIDFLYTSDDGSRLYFQRYKRTWDGRRFVW